MSTIASVANFRYVFMCHSEFRSCSVQPFIVRNGQAVLLSPAFHLLVALPLVPDLLLFAKHLLVAAMVVAIAPDGGSRMSNRSSSALDPEQGLASIPMAGGGLSRLAIARLESAGVPVAPLLSRVGLTVALIADPEERLSVQSQ